MKILDSGTIDVDGFHLDGNSTHKVGLTVDNCDEVTIDYLEIEGYGQKGIVINNSQQCTFSFCSITDTFDNGEANTNGTGIYIKSIYTDEIEFYYCTISGNAFDGIGCNPEDSPDTAYRMSSITLNYCTVNGNGRQGLRTQEVDTVRVTGGEFNGNGASGIQIEADTYDIVIDGAEARGNNLTFPNEAGIWVHESKDVTLENCYTGDSAFGIRISHSELVDIDNCDMDDCDTAGLRVSSGANYWRLAGGSPLPMYTPMLKAGVRDLTIHADCGFDNNPAGKDILYGDENVAANDGDFMRYYDNEYLGSSTDITSLPFNLSGGGTGYVTGELEDLD